MGSENRDERLKKFEKSQIKTPQQQTEALQKAQVEIGGLTNERQALLKQQQNTLMGYQHQLGVLQGQATALSAATPQQPQINAAQQARAMNAQTQAILQKYGVNPRKPQATGSRVVQSKPIFKSTVAGAGTTNIRTENKTIYNTKTTNSVQVIQPQGNSQITIQKPNIQVAKPVIQLRNQISQQIQAQNQQYEQSKKSFLRSDISLRKGADMMMRKIDAASKRFAENMNPQKLAASSIDSTKVIMMMAVAYLGIKLIGPISRRLDKLYFWFTGETPEGEEGGSGGYNEHMGFFDRLKAMVDTKKDDSLATKIIKFFKDGFEDLKGYLELIFQDRAKAIAAVRTPNDRDKGMFDFSGFGIKYIPAYLADVFRALIGGTEGLAKSETRQQTKEIEEEGRKEMLKNQGLPEENIFNGTEKAGITAMATKVGIWGDQYMIPMTEGGVVKNKDGSYSVAQIQAQHEIVRKNITNPLGGGSTVMTTDYAYQLGGKKINIFSDERTKKYVTRLGKLKKLSLLPFILARMKAYQKGMSRIKEEVDYYDDLYKSLVKLLDSKIDYDKGWYKETKSHSLPSAPNGQVITIEYEVYHFPESEEENLKSSIEKLIDSLKQKHLSKKNLKVDKVPGKFEDSEMDLTRIDKGLYDVIKKVYDIKEFNLADENAVQYYKDVADAKYKADPSIVNENGQQGRYYNGETNNATFNDTERISEAQKPIYPEWDLKAEKEKYWMTRNQDSFFLNSDFIKNIRKVASDIGDDIVNFRTDDNIEKSAPIINRVAEYLSQTLGIPKDAAIGIVSNLWAESRLNPIALGDKKSSLGIAQWHYKKGIQEVIKDIEEASGIKLKTSEDGDLIRIDTNDPSWQRLKDFTKDNENYQQLLFNQLNLIVKHLKEAGSSSDYGQLYQQLKRSNNPMSAEDASQLFTELFEKPKDVEEAVKLRREYAAQMKRYLDHNYQEELKKQDEQVIEDWRGMSYGDVLNPDKQEVEYPTNVTAEQRFDVQTPIPFAVKEEEKNQTEVTDQAQSENPSSSVNIVRGGDQNNNITVLNQETDQSYNPISS